MRKKLFLREVIQLLSLCCMFFFPSSELFAQNSVTVQGVILDATTQEPLIGVSVLEKGTTNGTITNLDGKFNLDVASGATVAFSYIGYLTQEVKAENVKGNILLKEDSKTLDEVVVVGYGIQKKTNLTGAVSQVTGNDITSKASTDILNALQGQMPGVTVLRSSGQPGSETSGIRVRGFSSANEASALVLIDGVEGDMKLLNPEDVESISILKDAASASIYGARAAAGVVLVTTKKGKQTDGKANITYNGSFGVNLPGFMPQRMSPWEEQQFIDNPGRGRERSLEQDEERRSWIANPNYNYRPNNTRWEAFANTNWLNEGTSDYTTQQSHAVSVNGGSDKLRYYLSTGYYTKDGLLSKHGEDNYSRYNLRATIDATLSKYADINFIAGYEGGFTTQSSYGSTNLLSEMYSARGRQLFYLPEEDTNYETNPYSGDLHLNTVAVMKNGGLDKIRNEKMTGKIGLHLHDFVKGLSVDLNASRRADYYNRERDRRTVKADGRNGLLTATTSNANGAKIANYPNSVEKTKNYAYQDKLEALLNYDLKIEDHTIHAMLGASYEQYLKDQTIATARNLASNDFFSLNYYAKDLATNSVMSDLIEPWKMASLFGRLNYDYKSRYLFEANFRYDGSSRLAPGKRWGLFPSFSLGWRVSEEKFFEPLKKHIDNLKLRANWGKLGNSTVLDDMYYPYIGTISGSTIMGKASYYQDELASQNITWEVLTSTGIAVDLGLFNNRLNMSADYFWKRNSNMLSKVEVAHLVGVNIPYVNMGELKTWGWEISVNWRDKIGNVEYSVGFNIDDDQNELVKFGDDDIISTLEATKHLQGYPLNSIWGYQTAGFWSSREEYEAYKAANPGYISFEDAYVWGGDVRYIAQGNADHQIGPGSQTTADHGDLVYMGTTNARYHFGINLGAKWKGFDLSMFFQGVGKRSFFINPYTLCPLYYSYQMPWTIHQDHWTEDNQDAYFARINGRDEKIYNYYYSDKWVQNGAYIRLKNISLGYTVPGIPKNILQSLRVYITGTDVWEHNNVLSAFDPEAGNNAGRTYYPFFRTWTMGVNINF
ncbi:MAG: TonB-dependent receptor [Mediterranea sp.]|nr:TonB-dependent receptor [Mediterranea sp.]